MARSHLCAHISNPLIIMAIKSCDFRDKLDFCNGPRDQNRIDMPDEIAEHFYSICLQSRSKSDSWQETGLLVS